ADQDHRRTFGAVRAAGRSAAAGQAAVRGGAGAYRQGRHRAAGTACGGRYRRRSRAYGAIGLDAARALALAADRRKREYRIPRGVYTLTPQISILAGSGGGRIWPGIF